MSELDTLYLENIDEYVHDQDKIVTYKWLSLTLGVHVNTAKQMLFHYLEQKRRESSAALHATFLLSGKAEDEQGRTCHKVSVVREEELEEAKTRLRVVLSVHVYSVHKALLRDSSPLFGVDYDAVKNNLQQCNKFSAIHCPDAVPLSNAELQQRESRPAPVQTVESSKPPPETKTGSKTTAKPKGIMGIFAQKPKTEAKPEAKPEAKLEPKPEPIDETTSEVKKPSPKSNAMANFFGNQTTKKPVVKEQSSSPTEQRPPQASRDQRSKSKRVESDSDEEEPQEKKKKRRRIRKPQSDSSDDEVTPESSLQTRTESPVQTRAESPVQTRAESPVQTRAESPVQTRAESPAQARTESPEKSVSEEEAEPAAPGPAPQTETQTTKIRKRRRVLKSKTFLDDEGCIVTEKVYESESYSEDEELQTKPGSNSGLKPAPKAAPVKPQEEKKKKKTAAGAKVTKQASIMGFFNRK